MGYLKSIGTSIIYIGAFLAAITFIPGIPPDAEFTEYSITAPKALEGNFAFNKRLNDAEHLFEGQVKGAEAFASFNGELYTGIHGGYVVKITKNKLIPIVKFGKECDGIRQESKCGRPLGLKFDKKGTLYVCDAYYGIFKVDVTTKKYERLFNKEKPIQGKIPMIFNSLDVANNGDIYWTDSSTQFNLEDGVYTMIANPSGRLIRYNAATKENQVLINDLGFPNGVALSANEEFVIVLESLTSRIIKYNIKGSKQGQHEMFIEGLPGIPDNVHSDNQNGFLISLIEYADPQHPQLIQSLMPHPYIRRMLARLLTLLEAPFKCLQSYYPNFYTEQIIHYLGGFESMTILSPKITTVIQLDNKGNIIDAAYNTDKSALGVSSAYIHNEFLWLGSPFAEYIARVPLKQAFPNLVIQKKEQLQHKDNIQNQKNNIPKQEKSTSTTETPKPKESPKSNPKISNKEQKSTQNDKVKKN